MASARRRVFLSYSHEDRAVVEPLTRALGTQKVDYWSDHEIRAGEEWERVIQSALESASVYVLLISPDFLASQWGMFEIGYALSRAHEAGARVVPVILRDVIIPESLQRFRSVDARRLSPTEVAGEIQRIIENVGSEDSHKVLRPGSHGPLVLAVQNELTNRGYYASAIDGIYGSLTIAAVKAFQLDNGLVPDGEVGESTFAALGINQA